MSKMYCVGDLKASPWVGARPVLGTAPTVPRVGALQVLGGVPVSFVANSVRLDRALRATTNHVWAGVAEGEWGSLRRGTPVTLSICPASRRLGTVWLSTLSMCSSSVEALHMRG